MRRRSPILGSIDLSSGLVPMKASSQRRATNRALAHSIVV